MEHFDLDAIFLIDLEDDEEEDDTEQNEVPWFSGAHRRRNACRECGMWSIIGPRYEVDPRLSYGRPAYSICRQCWLFNHDDEDQERFRIAKHGVTRFNAPAEKETLRLKWNDDGIAPNPDLPYGVKALKLDIARNCPPCKYKVLTQSYVCNLQQLDVTVHGAAEKAGAIKALVAALQGMMWENIRWVSLTLRVVGDENQDEVAKVLNELLLTTYVHHLSLRVLCQASGTLLDMAWLEDGLFDSLAHTHVRTFGYFGILPVKDHNQKKAWRAMEMNPNLRRIHVHPRFQSNNDNHLSFLSAQKRHDWRRLWIQGEREDYLYLGKERAPTPYIMQMHEADPPKITKGRGFVLQEAIEHPLKFDKVQILYHFLRMHPTVISEAAAVLLMPPETQSSFLQRRMDLQAETESRERQRCLPVLVEELEKHDEKYKEHVKNKLETRNDMPQAHEKPTRVKWRPWRRLQCRWPRRKVRKGKTV
ncbi:expressed unknown protein [Seminavis robusta]|uniref:Uncharacterized protein n=1 Tax=Seminavis robusta TaxID=568900 RepID=A0A9N8DEM8_9STRA|nr:expressed unknown protein [Seminavis robusta]|eukprot:Sro53_g031600.1 n/a (475) ;mRNA; r:131116-132540